MPCRGAGTRGTQFQALLGLIQARRFGYAADNTFPCLGATGTGKFIENRARRGGLDIREVVLSGFADLSLLSRAHLFIGSAESTISCYGYYLVYGNTGFVPPHAWMDYGIYQKKAIKARGKGGHKKRKKRRG